MKKILLPSCAILFLFAAPKAQAALSESCKTLLDAAPISSHYTQEILDRADAGIAYAKNEVAAADFSRYLPSWTRSIASGVLGLIDTDLRVTEAGQDLLNRSACLRFDLSMIECAMENVRQEMNTELERGSFLSILRLKSLLSFLNDRYAALVNGALNPDYIDAKWNARYLFDPPAQDPDYGSSNAALCPFHSDYAPPMPSGFGCDLTVMTTNRAASWGPMFAERASLDVLQTAIKDYREATQADGALKNTLETLRQSPIGEGDANTPDHLAAFGCPQALGTCAKKPSVRCNHDVQCGIGDTCIPPAVRNYCLESGLPDCRTNNDCPRGDRCILVQPVCALNTFQACNTAADCEEISPAPRCVNEARTFIGLTELRGPFSVDTNHMNILEEFLALRITQGGGREFSNTLKTADEFPPNDPRSLSRKQENPFLQLQRLSTREYFRLFSAAQALDEAASYPATMDTWLQTKQQGETLQNTIALFNGIAQRKLGLRGFVIKIAYWTRRTCVFGPCSEKLDRLLRIAMEDACFPYASGDFLADTAANPRFEQCAKQACIPIPGIELPEECDYLKEK